MIPHSIRQSAYGPAVQAMWQAALAAVEPGAAVRRWVRREGDRLLIAGQTYDLSAVDRLWLIGAGKAALPMADALYRLLGERLSGGLIITRHGALGRDGAAGDHVGPVAVVKAGHPLPDEAGVAAARRMAALLASSTDRDLVLAVISGGGSALLALPSAGLRLQDLQSTTDLLLRSGATIVELNTVRKHLSQVKGGGLARLAHPSPLAALILSDVVGDPLDTIASGPTAPDDTTFAAAWGVLERYGLTGRVPEPVARHLQAGLRAERLETAKPGDPAFARVQNVIVGSNRLAAEAAAQEARRQGLAALILSTFVEGEACQVGRVAAALARELVAHDRPLTRPACLIWGGETTVTVRGAGRGGRNQELALAAALALDGVPGVLLLALGTDGIDGPTDAAGAIATGQTAARARALGLDPAAHLADNDSYPVFDALDDLLRTGPTGTNVNDLLFVLAHREDGGR